MLLMTLCDFLSVPRRVDSANRTSGQGEAIGERGILRLIQIRLCEPSFLTNPYEFVMSGST
jgi:hypothetical protein